jgi:uncharacterized protein YndB with AHSA1/START domain
VSVTHSSFTIERRYSCTPAQAFSAFSDPDLKRKWFAADPDHYELDFRVGGGEVNSSGSHRFRSRFHDIVPDQRIVFAYDLWFGEALASVSLTTIELAPDGDGTRLTFTEQGAFLDGVEADPSEREHGTGKLLDALERFLAQEPVR